MRYAILDLGTNTFNLLIIETGTGNIRNILLSRKEPVKLGENGITQGKISDKAFERGLAAIEKHVKYIKDYRADHINAYATSAIRSAGNGLEFVRVVYERFNIGIQVIPGDKEAELIYHGVKQAVDMGNTKHLILDIGGGSNELIIADGKEIYWKESFPLGMARLLEQFRPSDPVTATEILAFEAHFEQSLRSFLDAAAEHKPSILIGSSGTFDTFRAMLAAMGSDGKGDPGLVRSPGQGAGKRQCLESNIRSLQYKHTSDDEECDPPFFNIDIEEFKRLHKRLLESDAPGRLRMEGMDPMRVEMIVIAAIFVNFIVRRLDIRTMIQSGYSLKEGAVSEIIDHQILSA